MSELLLISMSMGGMMASLLVAGIILATKKKTATKTSTTPNQQAITITPDQRVTIADAQYGKYLGLAFHPNNASNMCDLTYPSTTPGQFMLSKNGSGYSIKANCDGDGKFTSYLADNANDLIQPKRTASNETWVVECQSNGCTIQSTKSKKYLATTSSGPTLSTTKMYWTLT